MGIQIQRVQDRQLSFGGLGPALMRRPGGKSYTKRVLGTEPTGYWPLTETSGDVAHCMVNEDLNGSYAGTYTLAETYSPTGEPCPWFSGGGVPLPAGETMAAGIYNRVGSLIIWACRDDPPGWNTQDTDYVHKYNFTNAMIGMHKLGANFGWRMNQGATTIDWYHNPGPDGWFCAGLTWDRLVADEAKAYLNGEQYQETKNGLPWIYYGYTDYAYVIWGWSGWVAHAAVWKRVLSGEEMADLYYGA